MVVGTFVYRIYLNYSTSRFLIQFFLIQPSTSYLHLVLIYIVQFHKDKSLHLLQ